MKYKAGDIFPPINVETSKGANLALPDPNARYTHVQFRRFSGCPMCNTHIASLRQGKDRLDAAGIHEVLFFHSSQQEVASFHADLPFDAIGDKEKRYYKKFGVESLFLLSELEGARGGVSDFDARPIYAEGDRRHLRPS